MANKYGRRCWERRNNIIIPEEKKKPPGLKMNIFMFFSFHSLNLATWFPVNCDQFQKITSPVLFCINLDIFRVTDHLRWCPSAGPVVLSSPAQLVAPVLVARGTLSVTTSEIYFEVDEDDPAFKRADARVRLEKERLEPFFLLNYTATDLVKHVLHLRTKQTWIYIFI